MAVSLCLLLGLLALPAAAGPRLNSPSIPGQGSAGSALSLSVPPLDTWSQVSSTAWSFGDGTQASGVQASHAYSAAGTYPVGVTSTDTLGNASTTTRSVVVTGPSSGSGPDTTAPVVSRFSLTGRKFRTGRKRTPRMAKRNRKRKAGTTFRYALSEAATVKITIRKRTRGRRAGRKCGRATGRQRGRCTRYVRVGTLTRTARQGASRTRFTGRIGRRKLRHGRYRASIRATDAAGNASKRKRASFTVTRR